MPGLVRIWLTWFALVLFVSLPWIGFTSKPQWHRVNWMPFHDPADRPRDAVLNGLLFVPLGFAVSRRCQPMKAVMLATVMALSISIPAETTQLFSERRFPSATDVLVAVMGAVTGAITTISIRESSKPRTWTD